MNKVGLALGSNLGDRLSHLQTAARRIREGLAGTHYLASGVYETAPVDCPPGSPSFFNAVIEVETVMEPHDLLDFCQEIERSMGRPTDREINAPRTADIDILYYSDLEFSSDRLIVPHPRMNERAFVQAPLAEIRPDLAIEDFSCGGAHCKRLDLTL